MSRSAALQAATISWLYLSDSDIESAAKLMAAWKEDDAADSLGLRQLNDLFSEWLYPGLTTPMTHARYFVFIPALFQILESRPHLNANRARQAAKDLQHKLRQAIGDARGNIGREAGEHLKKWPSTIYWNALRDLGIFLLPLPEGAYYKSISGRAQNKWRSEDGYAPEDEDMSYWDDECPPVKDIGFVKSATKPNRISFDLTRAEGKYLLKRFIAIGNRQGSLLAHRLTNRDDSQTDFPWQVKASPDIRRKLRHAQALSAAARGLSLVYFREVHRAKGEVQKCRKVEQEFEVWRSRVGNLIGEWNLVDFADLIGPRFASEQQFLIATQRCLGRRGITSDLATLVTQRELSKKRTKCRLCGTKGHRRYLNQWERSKEVAGPVDYAFDYRHGIGQRVLVEILQGLSSRVRS